MLTVSRPAIIETMQERLDREFASARWTYHRLLDFEAEHQRVLDAAAEAISPGILRVGRILATLARRARRASHASPGSWSPKPRPELVARLKVRLAELRTIRNADPRWKTALGWANEQVGEPKATRRRRAKPAKKVRRRKSETDEAFDKRFALLTKDETDEHYAAKLARAPRRTRREAYQNDLYQQRLIYWGTWNHLVQSANQARKSVLKRRRQGMPAAIRRPKYRDSVTIAADRGGFRVIERSRPWWTIEVRVGLNDEWIRFRAKCGNWHEIPEGSERTLKITRRKDGERWSYSMSMTVDMDKDVPVSTAHVVSFDWGHREHGHARAVEGLRVFTWLGDDGESGQILLPAECREAADAIDAMKSRLDTTYDARKRAQGLVHRNRYLYRRSLMQSGVRTQEESDWLRWETRYERRISSRRKRIVNLRREVYNHAVRQLRTRYSVFAFEDESVPQLKRKQKDEEMPRRRRSNRDLASRYEFTAICERSGAEIVTVPARNSTRECPDCGELSDNGPELLLACQGCGRVRDKDLGAAMIIMARAKEALANRAA